MTFIGISCTDEHADIVTDTPAYTGCGSKFRPTDKVVSLTHLDSALTTSGHGHYGALAEFYARRAAVNASTFDEFVDTAPNWLRPVRSDIATDRDSSRIGLSVFLIGHSHRANRFVAWVLRPADGFTPQRLPVLHVQPTPFTAKPADYELDRAIEAGRAMGFPQATLTEIATQWTGQQPLRPPADDAAWVELLEETRAQRSLSGPAFRVWVAGSAKRTRITRGATSSRTLIDFNDTGEELRALVSGSLHPVAQISQCVCRSGIPAHACCLQAEVDMPCECGSGQTFGDCCRVDPFDDIPLQLWTTPFTTS